MFGNLDYSPTHITEQQTSNKQKEKNQLSQPNKVKK